MSWLWESDCHCQGDCVYCALCQLCRCPFAAQSKVRGQQQANASPVRPVPHEVNDLVRLTCPVTTYSGGYMSSVVTMLPAWICLPLSPLSPRSFPACPDLPSLLGKLQSVSAICSPDPLPPNYNTSRSCTVQHTDLKVQQPLIISSK